MLILVSHPQTLLEEQHIWQGNMESVLSPLGLEQRTLLEYNLSEHTFDEIYLAPVEHLIQTIVNIKANNVNYIESFTDRDMGILTGKTHKETIGDFPRRKWLEWERTYLVCPPHGESFYDMKDRIINGFNTKVQPILSSQKVLIVGGTDLLKIIIGYLKYVDDADIPHISVEAAVPYVFNGDIN